MLRLVIVCGLEDAGTAALCYLGPIQMDQHKLSTGDL